MRYGVFSDVHGNYEALKAVLDFYRKNGVENFVCCGDIVGYGPQPSECVEALRGMKGLTAVLGNHDAAVVGRMDVKWFNTNAAWAIEFARKNLTGEALDFIARLPERAETAEFTVVHGSPRKPLTEYLLNESQFADNAKGWTVSPCFIGHSHMPMFFRNKEGIPAVNFMLSMDRVAIPEGPVMFNPGSVGQPRDGDPRASCAIYDPARKLFDHFKVFYDVGATQQRMADLKMPGMLAERLSYGF
ncbi:MAG: metallophosphoesterase family protein [Elusimicrobiales bacterium]|nr:metallophosphoesterase family protein [Elusimicrobiales bacterium]